MMRFDGIASSGDSAAAASVQLRFLVVVRNRRSVFELLTLHLLKDSLSGFVPAFA
jgi:hypothetical protein